MSTAPDLWEVCVRPYGDDPENPGELDLMPRQFDGGALEKAAAWVESLRLGGRDGSATIQRLVWEHGEYIETEERPGTDTFWGERTQGTWGWQDNADPHQAVAA